MRPVMRPPHAPDPQPASEPRVQRPRPAHASPWLWRRMRRAPLLVGALLGGDLARAVEMAPLEVTAERLAVPAKQADETVYTGTAVTAKGIEHQGTKATMQVYQALNWLPGVSAESPDHTGLSVEQTSVRLRGVRGMLGTLTVAGVPNYGGNPIGPRDYLYDLENFSAMGPWPGPAGSGQRPLDGPGVNTATLAPARLTYQRQTSRRLLLGAALLAGIGLALAGAVMQTSLRNPLA